eukprot:g10303.t2
MTFLSIEGTQLMAFVNGGLLRRSWREAVRVSVGLGVAFPLGPGSLELTFAQPLRQSPNDVLQRWQLGLRLHLKRHDPHPVRPNVMSLLATSLRRIPRPSGAARMARRCLGDSVTGPGSTDFAGNLPHLRNFFMKPAVSYGEFKQQCIAVRLFAFVGTCSFCVLSLIMSPPKSSYWIRPLGRYRACVERRDSLTRTVPLHGGGGAGEDVRLTWRFSVWACQWALGSYAFAYIRDGIVGSSPPLFLTEKIERDTDVPEIAKELIATRRLLSGGSDSEEEH